MAKRSREDFEPSLSPEEEEKTDPSVRIITSHLTTTNKIQHLSSGEGNTSNYTTTTTTSSSSSSEPAMRCSLPPHRQTLSFQTFEEYEVHYAKEHTHRCLECRKNFPTGHFLNLHIEENHDSLMGVRRERGEKTYACFVTDCDRLCSTPQKRRMHLIDKHAFPKDYDFFIVNDGIDRRSSMLRSGRHRRGSSAAIIQAEKARKRASSTLDEMKIAGKEAEDEDGDEDEMNVDVKEGEEEEEEVRKVDIDVEERKRQVSDAAMEDLVGGISALKFVPPSVRFGRGRGKGRGGFSRS